ncbi:MAG: usg protein [Rhodobiaceae bacterium]|nr:usg protein [Rhodobiaceae bacterium]MCC0016938.1 usg protein [Rhodobiaceae bacterium]MCC0054158.1 usg protein [Rhodobiaceae bacterium]
MICNAFARQMAGYGLTTARILYRLPDHPGLLQEFIWQTHDLAPEFPELRRFVDFWKAEIEGPLHSVFYAHKRLIGPNEWRTLDGELLLN